MSLVASSQSCLIGEGPLKGGLVLVQVLELQQANLAQGLDGVMSRLGRHHELHAQHDSFRQSDYGSTTSCFIRTVRMRLAK